jgi:hypothetical protein
MLPVILWQGWETLKESREVVTAGCIDIDLPAGRPYFGQSDKPLIETAKVHHARWVMFTETRCEDTE